MQIIYISNRIEILNATLRQVAIFMPFVKEAIILCPQKQISGIICPSNLKLISIADESLDVIFPEAKHQKNHVFRNYFLRRALLTREEVQEEFILSDDDYRPIRPIESDFFKSEGKYQARYFYDLEKWTSNATAFDKGMHQTYVLLKYLGLPTLGFASHMPQIMNKTLFAEAASFFQPYAAKYPLCEWTTYFNYNIAKHPELFHAPQVYETLCWPELPLIWPWFVKPEKYSFENYCPALYKAGGILEDLSAETTEENWESATIEKLQRLYAIEIGRIELPYHKKDPLRKGLLRSLFAKLTWLMAILNRRGGRRK